MGYHVICHQNRTECFAYAAGFCAVLRDGKFDKPCPFFKTMAAYNDMQDKPCNGKYKDAVLESDLI